MSDSMNLNSGKRWEMADDRLQTRFDPLEYSENLSSSSTGSKALVTWLFFKAQISEYNESFIIGMYIREYLLDEKWKLYLRRDISEDL